VRFENSLLSTVAAGAVAALVATLAPSPPAAQAEATLPVVSPAPQDMRRAGADVTLPGTVQLAVSTDTDRAALDLLQQTLRQHGIRAAEHARLTVHLGPVTRADVAKALGDTTIPDHAEGSALRVGKDAIAIGGTDAAGQYYGVQTFRQLFTEHDRVAGVRVSDYPAMPLRGAIEGFYGSPWTQAERLDQLAFYGDVKANTYIYAPKDDPYHRDRWRDPYPADKLAELKVLVDAATAHHVRFTYAISPGTSICYSSADDRAALTAKLRAMYDLGVRAFSVPLDDISYTRWNCAADQTTFGAPGRAAAGRAQVDLLNDVQHNFVNAHDGTHPLQMVPTEYGDLTDTAYKQVLRTTLDPAIMVMWTGTDVIPPSITVDQAEAVSTLFGRKVFVWDNYPVNDYGQAAGRLLLAPYDHREPGLSDHVAGIVANPMNQAGASTVALFTIADFTWHDRAYDRDRSWRAAASYLAGGDRRGVQALLDFFDLNHLAPTFGPQPWQPQAPVLSADIAAFWPRYSSGDPGALRDLRAYVRRLVNAPGIIRSDVSAHNFVSDADHWLTATSLWARAMNSGLDTLAAIQSDDADRAANARAHMDALQDQALQIRSVPGENRVEGVVQIGDGVIDVFLDRVRAAHDAYLGLPPLVNTAAGKPATQISDYSADYGASRSVDGDLFDFSTTSGAEPQPWWQVDLGALVAVETVKVYNRVDCCAERVADYYVLVSDQPFPATLAEALARPGVVSAHQSEVAGRPTTIDLPATGRYVRVWLATTTPTELNMSEVAVLGRT